jgi:hypothetical protein
MLHGSAGSELTPSGASRRIASMKGRNTQRPLLVGLLLAALAGPGSAGAELWRWVDADGVVRYTPDPDRVPAASRSTLLRVEAGMPPAPAPEPARAQPLPIFAPPGDPALAEDPWNAPERAREIESEILRDPREIVVEVPSAEPPSAPPSPSPPQSAPREVVPVEVAPPGAGSSSPATTTGPVHPALATTTGPVLPAPATTTEPVLPAPATTTEAVPLEPGSSSLATTAEAVPLEQALPALASTAEPARPLSRDAEARRDELIALIARDEEALKQHVSSGDATSIIASPELRAIAERLPALQAELRALDAQGAAP